MTMDDVQRNGEKGRYSIARYEASNALRMAEQTTRTDLVSLGQYTVGHYSYLDHDYKMALFFLKKAEKSTARVNLALRHNICRRLWNTYEALDSLDLAFQYANQSAVIGDSLLAKEREAALHRLAIQFETQEKREQIEKLEFEKGEVVAESKQQKKGLATLGGILAAALLTLFVIVRVYKNRMRVNKLLAAQSEEISQQKIRDLENNLKIENMQSMLAGQESERQRVAQDLHDSVGGLLAAVKIQLETMLAKKPERAVDEDWIKIRGLLDETVSETRHIARNMQPSALLEFGLVTALRDLTNRVHGEGVPHITFQHFGEFKDIDREIALNCYRIIQELVQNSLKHAQAKEMLVQITRTDNELALLVEDDGVGSDPKNTKKGMGTDNIARRTQFLKGELSVQTAKGQGTSTVITLPIPETQGKP
jgi:signal transduction histidine kinase